MEPPSALPVHSPQQKRTRFNHSDEEWETKQEVIRQLYVCRKHPLKETMTIMRDRYGFQAGERKYKAKIKEWGFEKNLSLSDMMVITTKVAKRAREEGKDTLVLVGGAPMDAQRMETFKKRKFVKEIIPESPSAETPINITYRTPESGNPETPGQIFGTELEQPDLLTQTGSDVDIRGFETMKRVLENEPPSTVVGMARLASTYWSQGRWIEAEKLQLQVMEMRLEVLGQEHLDTLASMGNLALTYRSQGRWTEAEKLQLQVMETHSKVLGQEHPDTLASMGNLALTYWSQGRWTEAEKLQSQVMEMRLKMLGQQHPDTLISMGNLALTYWNQGRWTEAEKLQLQVMEMHLKVLGQEHLDTLASMGNLALTYRNQGRWTEAENLQLQVMEMRSKVLGQEHPDTLISMGNRLPHSNDPENGFLMLKLGTGFNQLRDLLLPQAFVQTIAQTCELTVALEDYIRNETTAKRLVQLLKFRGQVRHNVLSLPSSRLEIPSRASSIQETCRVSMLLYGNMIIFPLPEAPGVQHRLCEMLRRSLDCCTLHDLWNPYCSLLVWATVVGAINARAETKTWHMKKLKFAVRLAEIDCWKSLKSVLVSFLWCDYVCDEPAANLWKEIS